MWGSRLYFTSNLNCMWNSQPNTHHLWWFWSWSTNYQYPFVTIKTKIILKKFERSPSTASTTANPAWRASIRPRRTEEVFGLSQRSTTKASQLRWATNHRGPLQILADSNVSPAGIAPKQHSPPSYLKLPRLFASSTSQRYNLNKNFYEEILFKFLFDDKKKKKIEQAIVIHPLILSPIQPRKNGIAKNAK